LIAGNARRLPAETKKRGGEERRPNRQAALGNRYFVYTTGKRIRGATNIGRVKITHTNVGWN